MKDEEGNDWGIADKREKKRGNKENVVYEVEGEMK
jgi:hypothetical protein